MINLTDFEAGTTPETFFLEILPEILSEVELPDGLGTERLQITITGEEGIELHFCIDEDGDLTIEEGQAESPPLAISVSDQDFMEMLCGRLRDRIRAEMGELEVHPKRLKRLVLPDQIVQNIKALNGNIQTCVVDEDDDESYRVTVTVGGGTPNLINPECSVKIDVPTILDIASGKEQAQQLFFQGRIKVDGDLGVVMGLMGAVSAPQ